MDIALYSKYRGLPAFLAEWVVGCEWSYGLWQNGLAHRDTLYIIVIL